MSHQIDKSKPVSVAPYSRIAGSRPHPTVRREQPLSVIYGTHRRSSVPSGQAKTPCWYTAQDARSLCYTCRNPCFTIPYISHRNTRHIAHMVLCWLQQKKRAGVGESDSESTSSPSLPVRERPRHEYCRKKAESIQLFNLINCVN